MLDFRLALASAAVRQRRGSGAPPAPPPSPAPVTALTAIGGDGWSATYPSPPTFAPDNAPEKVTLSRQGFDAAGQAVTVTEQLVITSRVRQPYPNQGLLTADRVALSDYVYATDGIAGVANGSAETSPKPVANWIMPHRLVVGNTVRLEMIAAHRNARGGRQVACVKFIATDGTSTVSQVVAGTVVSGRTGDRNAVVCFQCDLDISTLNPGLITCNAEVYPWIGGAASVAKSASDGNAAKGFSPRYFLKNTGPKTYYYVKTAANGGNDAAGAGSTDAAIATGMPFATVLAAINKAHADLGATSGVDMAEIRIGDDGGTPFVLTSSSTTRTQKVAALTITRDPTVPQANARVSFGATAYRPRLGGALAAPLNTGCLRFYDVGIVRSGNLTFFGENPPQLELIFENVTFDNGGFTATWLSNSHDYLYGVTYTGTLNASLGGTYEHRIFRGCAADRNYAGMDAWLLVGNAWTRPGALGAATLSGAIHAFNTFRDPTSVGFFDIGASADVSGFASLQNLYEYISTASQYTLRITGDSQTGNVTHIIFHNNSFTGFGSIGRGNLFYDEGPTERVSKLLSMKGNIHVGIAHKGDVYRAFTDGNPEGFTSASPSTRVGNWSYLYGVGCQGEFAQFMDANGNGLGSQTAQAHPGLGAKIGTSTSVRQDPLFTDYRGTQSGTVAGTGGGTYTLQLGSPAKSMVSNAVLSHDLAGNARPAANDSAGAFA